MNTFILNSKFSILTPMFTGIIETTAKLLKKAEGSIIVERPKEFTDIFIGQSIAHNGACVSVTNFDDKSISYDIVPETFAKTNLGTAKVFNLERAMSANGRFEGHVVLGHIDGTAKLLEKKEEGEGWRYIFEAPKNLSDFFVSKGSVSVNGVSLTIAHCNESIFEIAIIPQTIEKTNFLFLEEGSLVNIEADYFAKLLKKWQK